MALSAQNTLIIAVIVACVGGILLLFILYRVLRRPAQQPVPLPPKQELARYREQQAHSPKSRPPTWYGSGLLSAPPSERFVGSRSSLVPASDSRGGSPFRRPSINASESPSDDIFGSVPMALPLELPNLPFDTSSTSLSTAETDSPRSSFLPYGSTSDSSLPPRHPRSSSTSSPRPRPLSVVSGTSRNSIRGVPHGPHSQVQIILPAPLAFNDRISTYESPRLSVVDQWAPIAVRSAGNSLPTPRRTASNSEPRQSSLHPPTNPRARRASASASVPQSSNPPAAHHHRDYPNLPSSTPPPPVPQIPQQWLPDPLMGSPQDSGRGRSRDVVPSALSNERPPPPVDRPPPSGKLQKQSRSRA
ncbi:hypothetical protein B0H17DRAFT_630018 [Mycena rosella]|uniref:Uncharacterized protein n=1 Tax=Mycena rosella TaxID=1033263 RepID=A0AAD7M946_MYCRO|nr:hypothetical protein B0H17DRAFT_630018 [Mycena rosella]